MSIGPGANLAGGLTLGLADCPCPMYCDPLYFPACTNLCEIICECGGGGGGGSGGGGDDGGQCGGPHVLDDTRSSQRMAAQAGIAARGRGVPAPRLPSSCPVPPGLPPGCVTPGTRIALFPVGCAEAWELVVGDIVLTRTAAGEPAGEAVVGLRRSVQACAVLETEDGRMLRCSLSHEIMVWSPREPSGRRIVVADLRIADRLLLQDGSPGALRSVTRVPDAEVIQISLAGPSHLYLTDGLWSHNKAIPLPVIVPA